MKAIRCRSLPSKTDKKIIRDIVVFSPLLIPPLQYKIKTIREEIERDV